MSATPTTDQDYTRDLAADLAIQQAATEGPWHSWSRPAVASGAPAHGEVIGCTYVPLDRGEALSPEDARAIANAGTHAPAWLRRLIAAEAAIIAWAEAVGAPVPHDAEAERRIEERESRLLILAARIRAGREKGAGA